MIIPISFVFGTLICGWLMTKGYSKDNDSDRSFRTYSWIVAVCLGGLCSIGVTLLVSVGYTFFGQGPQHVYTPYTVESVQKTAVSADAPRRHGEEPAYIWEKKNDDGEVQVVAWEYQVQEVRDSNEGYLVEELDRIIVQEGLARVLLCYPSTNLFLFPLEVKPKYIVHLPVE